MTNTPVRIQANNIKYSTRNRAIYIDNGQLNFSSDYNYLEISKSQSIRMHLMPSQGQISLGYSGFDGRSTFTSCDDMKAWK